MFTKLPASIKIGPFDTTFVFKDKIDDDNGNKDSSWGAYTHGVMIELVINQHNLTFALDTVMHEVSHGVYRCAGLDSTSSEESVVTAMSTGWLAVLKDNPELLQWIVDSLKSK